MPDESKQPPPELKVTDRRSFTTEGNRRTPDVPNRESSGRSPAPAEVRAPSGPREPRTASGPRESPAVSFDDFVRYLAQVALHQMSGEAEGAASEGLGNLDEARQTIDILTMLKEKTKGNLTAPESRTLEDLLYHLKIEYTRRAGVPRR